MNLLKAANFLVNVCTCFLVSSGLICRTKLACLGETSMPLLLSKVSEELIEFHPEGVFVRVKV